MTSPTRRTCEFSPCEAALVPGEDGENWSTGVFYRWTLDPTEWKPEIEFDLCPEHRGYEPPPLDMESTPLWDPHWGDTPEWVIEERRRQSG